MKKKTFLIVSLLLIISCGYPDIDDVPNFNDIELTKDEVIDYCNNIYKEKKNIDTCIKDFDVK